MKAKEIAKKLEDENYSTEVMRWLRDEFTEDAERLIKARHANTDKVMLGIFRDHQKKWKAIARHTNGAIKEDAYFNFLKLYASEEVAQKVKERLK